MVLGVGILFANTYDNFIEDLSGDMKVQKNTKNTKSDIAPAKAKKIDKQIKEVQKSNKVLEKQFKEVKKSNEVLVKEIKKSNEVLIKEVKNSNKKIVYASSKNVIPVAMINEPESTSSKNSFLYLGFGYQGLSVADENGYFGINALDDSAINTKAGYGQYFDVEETKLFATAGFEYLSLKQADMKAITASINTESPLGKDVVGSIGLKVGFSYLVWDIQQDEAIESITSSSPLIGVQGGIEYKFSKSVSLIFGADYTKYFHKTQIPNDTLHTDSAYGFNISLKFYQ